MMVLLPTDWHHQSIYMMPSFFHSAGFQLTSSVLLNGCVHRNGWWESGRIDKTPLVDSPAANAERFGQDRI